MSPPNFPVVCAASFAGKPVPERRWIVRDMIPDNTVTLVSGDGGVGKSLLLGQLGDCRRDWREWIGTLPERGPVVFVSAEDDLDELHRRVVAIANAQGIDIAKLTDLHFVPLAGRTPSWAHPTGKSGIIRETPIWRGLVAIVERIEPKLVILDTLADVFAGNEIARQEARQFVGILAGSQSNKNCRRLARASELLGHGERPGTSGSTAWSNSAFARGSTSKRSKATTEARSTPTFASCAPRNRTTARRARKSACDGRMGASSARRPPGGFDKLAADRKAERVFLDLLGKLSAQGRDVSSKPSQSYAPDRVRKAPERRRHPKAGIRVGDGTTLDGGADFGGAHRAGFPSDFKAGCLTSEDRRMSPSNSLQTPFRRPSDSFRRGVRSHPLIPRGRLKGPPRLNSGADAGRACARWPRR